MSSFSSYLASKLAQLLFKNNAGSFTSPGDSLYVALFTADTGLASNSPSAEVSGGDYARVQVAAADWSESSGEVRNSSDVVFTQASADWGVITHAAIMDASTSGNVLHWQALTTPRNVLNEDIVTIAAQAIVITYE